jgi:hypothetical protein
MCEYRETKTFDGCEIHPLSNHLKERKAAPEEAALFEFVTSSPSPRVERVYHIKQQIPC